MKKLKLIITSIFLILNFQNLHTKLNEFGISDIVPVKKSSKNNSVFKKRITEEMGLKSKLTAQIILNFIKKIDVYFNHLLDTDNQDPQALQLVNIAITDVNKAEKMLKSNRVTPEEEHELRIALRNLNRKINSYK